MKKITRPFFGIMTILLLVLTAACSGDDNESTDGSNDIIVGEWKYIGWYDIDGEFIDDSDETGCYDEVLIFKSNGSGEYDEEDCEDGNYITPFNWEKLGDNRYKVTGEEISGEFTTQFETNDRVVFMEEGWEGGEVYARR